MSTLAFWRHFTDHSSEIRKPNRTQQMTQLSRDRSVKSPRQLIFVLRALEKREPCRDEASSIYEGTPCVLCRIRNLNEVLQGRAKCNQGAGNHTTDTVHSDLGESKF